MKSLFTILLLGIFISSEAQNISQSQVRQFNAVTPYRVFGRGAGVGTPSFITLDSNHVPQLHSQGYYDLRYGSLSIQNTNTSNISANTTSIANKWDINGNVLAAGVNFLGSINNVSLHFKTNNVETAVLDSNGNFGIGNFGSGVSRPASHLHVVDNALTQTRGITTEQNIDTNYAAVVSYRKSRGTYASPTAVRSSDYIGANFSWPHSGSSYIPTVVFGSHVSGTVTSTSVPSDFFIATSPTGTREPFGDGTVKVIIKSDGKVGIGDTIPTEKLTVHGKVRIDTLLTGGSLDSVVTVSGGVLRKVLQSSITGGGATSAASNTITEQKIYYRGEFIVGRSINTSTGAVTVSGTNNVSDFIHVAGGESVTISAPLGYGNITIYGWTYDTTLNPISEIRSNSLIGTPLSTYTFTAPSNARFINIYVKYGGQDFAKALQVKSTNTITYNTPITPEQFAGNKSAPIQAALDFARYTTSGVELKGVYTIDSTLILSSGSKLILNNARIVLDSASKTNIIRNEAVADPNNIFARGNRNIKIIGVGNATIEGSKSSWGGGGAAGVGTQYWRPIAALFANVQNFEISGVTFKSTNMWAFEAEQSQIGILKDITILQDSSKANQDGINIRRGSNRITIDNVKGVCWDDMVAMTNLVAYPQYDILGAVNYMPYAQNLDIHSIIIKNIQRDTSGAFAGITPPFYKNGILMLCADGLRIHDISIDGVSGYQQVQVGYTGYGTNSTVNDMYNIVVQNTNAAQVNFYRPVKNSSFINIPSLDVTGAAAGVFLNGSSKVLRKYYNANFEFYDSTFTGATASAPSDAAVVHKAGTETITGDKTFTGANSYTGTNTFSPSLTVTNATTTSNSSLTVTNDVADFGGISTYGAGFVGSGFARNTYINAKNSLIFGSDATVTGSGVNSIQFRTGGYPSAQERMRIFSNGAVGINTTADSTSAKLIVNGAALASSFIGSGAASGTATFSSTSSATKGKLLFGTSAYDELNNRLGIGLTSPAGKLDITTNNTSSDGVTVLNSNGAGSASVSVTNNNSITGFFRTYGSAFTLSHLANNSAFGSTGQISIFTDAAVTNGGTGIIKFYAGGYNANQERLRIGASGISIGTQANASAILHLPAGTSAAGTAPLKITTTSAALMTTPEAGAFETDGTDLYWTNSAGVRKKVTLQ